MCWLWVWIAAIVGVCLGGGLLAVLVAGSREDAWRSGWAAGTKRGDLDETD
jgi:hypothetical protein